MTRLIQIFKATSVFALFTFSIFAQESGLRIELASEPGVAKNGEIIYASGTQSNIVVNMYIKNISGADMDVKWERIILSSSNENANDQLCDDEQCYPTGILGPNWLLNLPVTIAADGQSDFKPELILPSGQSGTAEFMYYIRNTNDVRIDSVKIIFTSTASILNEPTVSGAKVYPNPSTGLIYVKNAPLNSTIEVTDMLGKVILKKSLNTTIQSFNLSSQPDGVYFYTIKSADGVSTSTKRLVLRK